MRKICLINNHNYGKFLKSCLDSVVNQTVKFDLVLVVDDGSIDNSKLIIESYSNNCPKIFPVFKKNGGQLSCFNAVVDYIEDDDYVFFLDSDDLYPRDYVENFLKIGLLNEHSMFFCDIQIFEKDDDPPVTALKNDSREIVVSDSSNLTRLTKCWVGNPTSAMMIRGELYKKIFPYPYESDWITRADDVLVYSSSLAGYEKVYIPSLCIAYRVHGENNFMGKVFNRRYQRKRVLKVRKLFLHYFEQFSLKKSPSLFAAIREFRASRDYYRMIGKMKVWKIFVRYFLYVVFENMSLRKVREDMQQL
jgi:glycosyltransferase involved in cell wall biosynthesis